MAVNLQLLVVVVIATLCFGASSVSARLVNISYLNNCQDLGDEKPVVYVTEVGYHIDDAGYCDSVKMTLKITTLDPEPIEMIMTLFKCEGEDMGSLCRDNPTEHTEMLTCDRLLNDDSGPWHMFTSVMEADQVCGKQVGEFELQFARLRLEHLMKYLDVYDSTFKSFRLKMYFKSTMTNELRGCAELDFNLLPIG